MFGHAIGKPVADNRFQLLYRKIGDEDEWFVHVDPLVNEPVYLLKLKIRSRMQSNLIQHEQIVREMALEDLKFGLVFSREGILDF